MVISAVGQAFGVRSVVSVTPPPTCHPGTFSHEKAPSGRGAARIGITALQKGAQGE